MRRLALAILAAILLPGLAEAQDRRLAPTIKLPIPLSRPAVLGSDDQPGSPGAQIGALLSKPFQAIADLINSDLDGAIKLSTQIPELQDGNGQQCWIAMKQFGAVVKAHPLPLTGHAATDLEAARLMAMAANKLCNDPHCTQVFADLAGAVQTVAPVNLSVPIPSLHDLCSKVPQVAVAPPVSVPPAEPATPTKP